MTRDKTSSDIASIFSVDPSTIRRWVSLGCPSSKSKSGHMFSESEVASWMKASGVTGKVGRPATKESIELSAAKLRTLNAMAEKYERENKVAAGILIDAATEEVRDVQKIVTLRNRLCGMGAMIVPQMEGCDKAQIQKLIDAAIEEILQEFATGYKTK